MADKFPGLQAQITSSADTYENVTPSDTNDLPFDTREVTVGTTGTVKVTRTDGVVLTIAAAVWTAQPTHAIRVRRIWSTGTTATDIFVKY